MVQLFPIILSCCPVQGLSIRVFPNISDFLASCMWATDPNDWCHVRVCRSPVNSAELNLSHWQALAAKQCSKWQSWSGSWLVRQHILLSCCQFCFCQSHSVTCTQHPWSNLSLTAHWSFCYLQYSCRVLVNVLTTDDSLHVCHLWDLQTGVQYVCLHLVAWWLLRMIYNTPYHKCVRHIITTLSHCFVLLFR